MEYKTYISSPTAPDKMNATATAPAAQTAPRALRKHVNHLRQILEGKHDRATLDKTGLRIDMVCNDHGYWGNITLDFSTLDSRGNPDHVMTYEAQIGYNKVKMGEVTIHDDEDEKLIASLRAALVELQYPHKVVEKK